MRTTFAVLVCALLLPGVAVAQSDTRSYVMGNGGVTFGTETAPMVGAQFGTSLGSSLQLYAGGGYYDNVLPGGVQTDLDQAAEALTTVTGLPWEFDAKARAFCVSGGARYLFDTGSAMRPYVSAGAGFVVAIAGAMMLMPGLGKTLQEHTLDVDEQGQVIGMDY